MKLILPILLFLSNLCMAHPLHVSVCEINHNAEKGWLEITIRIFADDFENVLEERTGKRTHIGKENELAETNTYITSYLKEKFTISVNGVDRVLNFIGKDIDDVALLTYLYIPDVKEVTSMTISNSIMVHWFDDQVNVTHIDCNDELKSTFFSKGRVKESFKW